MPSGKTHAAITTLAAASLAAAAYYTGQPRETMLALSGGCLAGILINPDLDIDQPTRSHYVMLRYGFPVFGLWYLIWFPYARLFSHRSIWTHTPIISTLIRAGYLIGLAWLVLRLTHVPWPAPPVWGLPALIGLVISDLLHWAADVFLSDLKHRIHRKEHQNRPE